MGSTLLYLRPSYSTLQLALYYLVLRRHHLLLGPTSQDADQSRNGRLQDGQQVFITSVVLATKYLHDDSYRDWSKQSGLGFRKLVECEEEFVQTIRYHLHVSQEVFAHWSQVVLLLSRWMIWQSNPIPPPSGPQWHMGHQASLEDTILSIIDAPNVGDMDLHHPQWWDTQLRKLSDHVRVDTDDEESVIGRAPLTIVSSVNLSDNTARERVNTALEYATFSVDI